MFSYSIGSVTCGSRGRLESIRMGTEGADSGSLIFSRIFKSWEVRLLESILSGRMEEWKDCLCSRRQEEMLEIM